MTLLVTSEEIAAASDDALIDLIDEWGDAYMDDEGIAHNLIGRDLMYELLYRWKPQYRPKQADRLSWRRRLAWWRPWPQASVGALQ